MEDAFAISLIVESQDIPEAISILSGITHDDCESLLEAICAQIRYEIAQKRQEVRNPKRKWYQVLLNVAARKHKCSGLQTRKLLARINCK